jgi:formylglycine-generating enzyme required for sulfatase activity
MGSNISPAKWDEQPIHKVKISQPFCISETEVTIEQFRQFKAEFEGTKDFDPYATGVSWYDAMAFCQWLSKKEGKPYRVPIEAEWEYACKTEPSLKNMLSSAREWCLDWYSEHTDDVQVDPIGAEYGIAKVVRGGGLDSESHGC